MCEGRVAETSLHQVVSVPAGRMEESVSIALEEHSAPGRYSLDGDIPTGSQSVHMSAPAHCMMVSDGAQRI